jgi:hypothetical protein
MRPPKGEGTFVVHCSSSLYQPFFQNFLRGRLGVEHYGLLALPGGVQPLTLTELLPKFAWSGWRQIKFLMDIDAPSRVILIGHDDCRWYHRGPVKHADALEKERQSVDLRKVAQQWQERFPETAVEMYYAHLERALPVFDAIH